MKIVGRTLWLPKHGNSPEEYEDAASLMESFESEGSTFRCAVADGATETSFSRLWAELLVGGYVKGADVAALQEEWQKAISGRKLAWYAEEKAERGAFAALLGLSLNDKNEGKPGQWKAEAVGDCCLLHGREGKVLKAFPLSKSEEFNNSPFLISSNSEDNPQAVPAFVSVTGDWQPGDCFYLMSDAISHWAFKREEEYGDVIHWLKGLTSQEELTTFCEEQRKAVGSDSRPLMRNDDVTIMLVTVT